MKNSIQPLFIFSLPRSGSTLVQRVMGAHPSIATVAEPWLLLPYLYTLKENGVYSEYMHRNMNWAIEDFCGQLPNGRDDYLEEIHNLAMNLYQKAARGDEEFFLDKTPRYHLIAEDIIRLFPEGKFIFLWRNPLAVISSIMDVWASGKWNLFYYKVDLYKGLSNLVAASEKFSERAISVRFEDLLEKPDEEWPRIFSYLKIPFDSSLLTRFNEVDLPGRSGDPKGVHSYREISREPMEKWKSALTNPLRKAWSRRYLNWIGKERLGLMGYDLDNLLGELAEIPVSSKNLLSDTARMFFGIPFSFFEPMMLLKKFKKLPDWKRIYWHS